ncbi:serine/threonine-protein kinase [Streptomyces sp. S.PNR 29]|uniref:serine/threonine-protein kinase n=1 Tax=Streptomyces sp. S.PNR 29 TaxID=2973805 RepID=UPI0025B012AF|nr:serine/threonine-protein kinase [Streptomyces sp. S.PNR 29]MDN0199797.1 serine/threonine protein kinase [Streptomyces sp. S.PNR 29]
MLIAGRYRLQDAIGRGAMGEVWRAFDETLGRPVAVKLLLPQDSDPTATSRFRLEAQTAGRLAHPHVVGVRDFGEHEDRLFLVMELVEGDSLASVLARSGALPAERVARIAGEAAAGLAAAHRQGIVHRDIKPANLLLDADGTLKIGDFGIARFLDDPGAALTATGQIIGTSLYLAPERALGHPAGPASDVYALGCVLYQLLTGHPPFHADSPLAVLHQHLDASPVPPRQLGADLPHAFENYLLGLLAKRPEDRPTADDVADWFGRGAWRGASDPLPREQPDQGRAASVTDAEWRTTVHRAAARRRQQSYARGSRLVAVVGAVAVFVAALVAGLAWFGPDTGSQRPQAEPSASASPPPEGSPAPADAATPTSPSTRVRPSPSGSPSTSARPSTPASPSTSPSSTTGGGAPSATPSSTQNADEEGDDEGDD